MNLLQQILEIGIKYEMDKGEAARVKMLNFLIIQFIVTMFVTVFAFINYFPLFVAGLVGLGLSVLVFVINFSGYSKTASYAYLFFANLVNIAMGMMLFDNVPTIVGYSIAMVVITTVLFPVNNTNDQLYGTLFAILGNLTYQIGYHYLPSVNLENSWVIPFNIFAFLTSSITISATIYYLLYLNENVKKELQFVLEESRTQNEELQASEEELRQNQEELMAQREMLERTSKELQEIQQNQISTLSLALEQQISAINKVALVSELSQDGKILQANQKFADLFHFTVQELQTINILELMNEKYKRRFSSDMQLVREGQNWSGELLGRSKHNDKVWLDVTVLPFYNAQKEFEKFFFIGFSIDEIKKQQQFLEENQATLKFYDESLTQFTQIMRWDGKQAADIWALKLLNNLTEYLSAFQGALYGLDLQTNQHLNLIAAFNYTQEQQLKSKIQFGEDVIGEIARTNKTIHLEGEVGKPNVNVAGKLVEIKSLLMMPLQLNDKTVGVLILTSLNLFDKRYIEFLKKISDNIAANLIGIQNKVYVEKLLEEAKAREEQMKAQEDFMRQNLMEMTSKNNELMQLEEELRSSQEQLQEFNANLEKIVAERTKELQKRVAEVDILIKQVQKQKKQVSDTDYFA